MIKYGLKLWTNNSGLFEKARTHFVAGDFDFIELSHNPLTPLDFAALSVLRSIPVTIHAPHAGNFHEFILGPEELVIWQDTLKLTDFFKSSTIVVHPGKRHTVETFFAEFAKITDPRIVIENMPGLDLYHEPMFAQKLSELTAIKEKIPLCFDFEKAIKAACYQQIEYKEFVADALKTLTPIYFHLSGGDHMNPVDEHVDLKAATFDLAWIKNWLEEIGATADIQLVFEVPKNDFDLQNDFDNMNLFRSISDESVAF
jgi:hypothetical protein